MHSIKFVVTAVVVTTALYFSQKDAVKKEITTTDSLVAQKKIQKNKQNLFNEEPSLKREPAQVQTNKKKISRSSLAFVEARRTLTETMNCYQSNQCHYSKADPKSYHYAVGQDLKQQTLKLEALVVKNNWKHQEISNLAARLLKVEDGHVKEAALHLLASQEKSAESLEALLNDIIHFHDPRLVKQAMFELRRYIGSKDEMKIHQSLSQAMTSGSPLVAQEISLFISFFINSKSLDLYQSTLESLPKSSLSQKRLKTSVEEFERLVSAA